MTAADPTATPQPTTCQQDAAVPHVCDTEPQTTAAPQPATPGEARKRVQDAKRHLFARIIASAHLLDTPFTNAPDQSPWTRLKPAMGALTAALDELDAAPAADPVYRLPDEPPVGSVRWDSDGERLERWSNGWVAPDQLMGPDDLPMAYEDLAHPLSATPPAGTEGDDAD